MEKHSELIYLHEAGRQCEFAVSACQQINAALEARNTLEVFRGIHSFLTHTSNVSKIFWPSRPAKKKDETEQQFAERCELDPRLIRARALRISVGLPEDGHPLKSRKLRDHLEHFDERLDRWLGQGHRAYVQDNIGPRGKNLIVIPGVTEDDYMRWFDQTTTTMYFRGEGYDVQELASAVEALSTAIQSSIDAVRHELLRPQGA
ncbi:hypothetical protein [Lysobacter soli]|uniref:hypothetical protein n=1 Tax=Lysobacter soli TaxID=453783 RepID=UPI002410695A|nr:hypothetical protein [Lysobacter soli]MDG2518403.1 hypothetical protein [Lysobacter soli]